MDAELYKTPTAILIQRINNGDDLAFHELFTRNYGRVLRSVAVRNKQLVRQCRIDLEDIIQEAFIYAWEQISTGKYEGGLTEGSFRNWLANHVSVNKLRDEMRKRLTIKRGRGKEIVFRDLFRSTSMELGISANTPSPYEEAGLGELDDACERVLLQMSDSHRQVVDLRFFCGFSFAEIAAEMGYGNPATARSILHRALKALRGKLGLVP